MKYCVNCGTKLILKNLENEGMIPYCTKCNEYRFPIFSTAVSMVIVTEDLSHTLLIKQYGRDRNILVAGYVNKGESLEEALVREMNEEIGISPVSYKFQKSKYFEKTNTLICNFLVKVNKMDIKPNYEIDDYKWFTIVEGKKAVYKEGLAGEFYQYFLDNNYTKKT